MLHRTRKPSSLIKVDIAEHMGFTQRWLNWISLILSMASTKIIPNVSPGQRASARRTLVPAPVCACDRSAELNLQFSRLGRTAYTTWLR